MRPEHLSELDRTEFGKLFVDGKSLTVQKFRDVLKECILKQDEHYTYLLLGIENQTDVHYAMPVKNMVYDALNYDRQVTEQRRRHEALKDLFWCRGMGCRRTCYRHASVLYH